MTGAEPDRRMDLIRFDLIVLAEQARAVGEQIQAELRQIAAAATRAMTLPRMW